MYVVTMDKYECIAPSYKSTVVVVQAGYPDLYKICILDKLAIPINDYVIFSTQLESCTVTVA